jgi:hypothetical protein
MTGPLRVYRRAVMNLFERVPVLDGLDGVLATV